MDITAVPTGLMPETVLSGIIGCCCGLTAARLAFAIAWRTRCRSPEKLPPMDAQATKLHGSSPRRISTTAQLSFPCNLALPCRSRESFRGSGVGHPNCFRCACLGGHGSRHFQELLPLLSCHHCLKPRLGALPRGKGVLNSADTQLSEAIELFAWVFLSDATGYQPGLS